MQGHPVGTQPVDGVRGALAQGLDQCGVVDALAAHHVLTIAVDGTGHGMTEEQIAADTGLSKVTVRRYLNYLIGTSETESQVEYSTGGRPRVEYRSR